jgi:nitrite reductase/ring-hydroxylating ferredoxin subunit
MTERRFPFPDYPDGWFRVGYSAELKPGDVQPIKYFGRELVLFRSESGKASVLDAYCPHLGAHLGYGGKVKGENIECPFHAWQIGGDGQAKVVPYASKVPPRACVRSWELCEKNGQIFVWHHGAGEPPKWQLPDLPEVGSPDWTEFFRKTWKIRTRNQEMAENSVDTAHFRYLHGTTNMPDAVAEAQGHLFISRANNDMSTPRGGVQGSIEVNAYGFGFTTTRFTGIVDTLLVTTVTSIDEEYVDVHFNFTVKKVGNADITKGVGKAFVKEVTRQLEQDIPVWENKIFLTRPLICDGDGPIGLFRSWARQFYSSPAEERAAE